MSSSICKRAICAPTAAARAKLAAHTPLHVPLRMVKVHAREIECSGHPGPQEEKDEAHEAFMHAFEAAKPIAASIPGLQQFAASIWERRRRIPSTTYNDPLDHIFTEFDENGDGHLTAEEVAKALKSRGVDATPEQVQLFIQATDANENGTVERSEFADFIFHMAVADLKRINMMDAST